MTFTDQPQFIVTLTDDLEAGTDLLISFWGGPHYPPEVAPRIDDTRWGVPLRADRVHS